VEQQRAVAWKPTLDDVDVAPAEVVVEREDAARLDRQRRGRLPSPPIAPWATMLASRRTFKVDAVDLVGRVSSVTSPLRWRQVRWR